MEPTVLSQLLPATVLAAILVWILSNQRKPDSQLRRLERELRTQLRHLEHELRAHLPVFSAETVRRKEAEFIRERLPHKAPRLLLILLGAFVVTVAVAWWLTR
jgi:hypothetical protein